MLASRARNRVRLVAPEELREDAGDRAVVDAFLAAAGSGDLSALLALLAPDVQLHVFTPEGVRLVSGAKKVAAQAGAGARRNAALHPVMRPVTVRAISWSADRPRRPTHVRPRVHGAGRTDHSRCGRSPIRTGWRRSSRRGRRDHFSDATSTVRLSMVANRRPSRESRLAGPNSHVETSFALPPACSRQPGRSRNTRHAGRVAPVKLGGFDHDSSGSMTRTPGSRFASSRVRLASSERSASSTPCHGKHSSSA